MITRSDRNVSLLQYIQGHRKALTPLHKSTCSQETVISCPSISTSYFQEILLGLSKTDRTRLPWGLPRAFSSPKQISPTPSTFLHQRGAPSLGSSSWHSSGPYPKAPHPSCVGGPRLGCRTPAGSSEGQSRGEQSPWPAGNPSSDGTQVTIGLLNCKHMLLAHVKVSVNQDPLVLHSRTTLKEFFSQFVYISGITSTQVQNLALRFVEPY